MITPHRYLNLDSSVINVAYIIISELKSNKILTYTELQEKVAAKIKFDISEVFPYALNFLYLLRKLHYYGGNLDAFEINETQQTLLQQAI